MRLVLSRGAGDCGIATLATLLEQTYEDVYVATQAVDPKRRGKSGLMTRHIIEVAQQLGVTLDVRLPGRFTLDDDEEGLLFVRWRSRSRHLTTGFRWHVVAYTHGVVVDTTDGVILAADEYLARERGAARYMLVEKLT